LKNTEWSPVQVKFYKVAFPLKRLDTPGLDKCANFPIEENYPFQIELSKINLSVDFLSVYDWLQQKILRLNVPINVPINLLIILQGNW